MEMEDFMDAVDMMRDEVIQNLVQQYIPAESLEDQWDVPELMRILEEDFNLIVPINEWIETDHSIQADQIQEKVIEIAKEAYQHKREMMGVDLLGQFERSILLQTMDNHWREHLAAMDHLRQGIHLRGYAQKDPKQEYKREAFALFSSLLDNIRYESMRILATAQINTEDDLGIVESQRQADSAHNLYYLHPQDEENQDQTEQVQKIGRNDPCSCGSGKKYKQCHGKLV